MDKENVVVSIASSNVEPGDLEFSKLQHQKDDSFSKVVVINSETEIQGMFLRGLDSGILDLGVPCDKVEDSAEL